MNKYLFFKLLLSTTFFITISSIIATSQCAITDLVITESECDDNDEFSVEINFNFNDTGTSGFQVLGNGNNYGTFQYTDLPITIEGLAGNCELEYEFIVRDVMDPTCASFVEFGVVCCDDECLLDIIEFETTDCFDNVFFGITLNLEHAFEGEEGYFVDINGVNYGNFSYEDLPLTIDEVDSGEEGNNIITVCDAIFPECCATYTFLNPCVCGMTNITSEILECNSNDSTYYVIIDFDHIATNDSFQMGFANGGTNVFLGVFAYTDLPITAGPLFLSDDEQEIFIADKENFFCFNSAYLGVVDDCNIECQIYGVFGEAYMCEEGEYFMDIEFEAEDIEGFTFDVFVDGEMYGNFEYGENFYTIGPIPSNCETAPILVVQDSGVESCSDFFNFSEPICCLPDCNFTSLDITTVCGPTMMTINGTFENNGTMLGGFYFVEFMGTSYGPFLYGDFMFSIDVPLLANGEYQINVNDSLDPECQISALFTVQCEDEPCIFFNVNAEPHQCENNQFDVDIEFDYAGELSDLFTISSNGDIYGPFEYGEEFYTVGPFEGDCETIYEFFISDQIFEGCNTSYSLPEPVCCSTECSISDLEILEFSCNDDDVVTSILLDFIYDNVPSDMFTLLIDGVNLGSYFYSDLPIPFNVELPVSFVIEIQDSEDMDCSEIQEYNLFCPTCSISDIELSSIECGDDGLFFAVLDFNHENTTDSFLMISAGNLDTALYSDLPILIGPYVIGLAFNISILDFGGGCTHQDWILIDEEDCIVGLEEKSFNDLNIIQSSNAITVENNEDEAINLRLISMTGIVVNSMDVRPNLESTFDTSLLPSGLYLLNISNQKSQKTVKLIVY